VQRVIIMLLDDDRQVTTVHRWRPCPLADPPGRSRRMWLEVGARVQNRSGWTAVSSKSATTTPRSSLI